MIDSLLLSLAIAACVQAADGPPVDATQRAAYRTAAAAAEAGHDAGAQVRLALWCEAHGLTAERLEQLSRAVRYQPSNELARGLLGLIRHRGRWEKPEVVQQQLLSDAGQQALEREYLDRRMRAPHTPDGQMKLAAWCESKHLDEQAQAHYHEVLRLDPSRGTVWRHLGYRKQGNRWVKPEQLSAEKQEAIRQKQADKRWRTKLAKLRDDLRSKDAAKRGRAEQALVEITDPRAVPSIWAVFVSGGVSQQMAAIQMLGQIDGPSASTALAALAVYGPGPEVRARATEALIRRDPRDVVGRLIAMVHKPLEYEVRPVQGPGSPGELFVEGERFNIQRLYENQSSGFLLALGVGRLFSPDVPFDPFSIRNFVMALQGWTTSPPGMNLRSAGSMTLTSTFPAPIAPGSAAQAAGAIATDPRNAPAILNQLISNPSNRLLPPNFWLPDPNLADTLPVISHQGQYEARPSTGLPPPQVLRGMATFAREVQAQQNNPKSPMGMAIQAGKLANNPANRVASFELGMMLQAQQMAAQRDMELGRELLAIEQANQNLRRRLAMDVQFIEWTNAQIKGTNERVLPVLKAVTGLDLGLQPAKWRSWWMDQLDLEARRAGPRQKPTYREYITDAVGPYNPYAVSPAPERAPTSTDAANGPDPVVAFRACFAVGTAVQTADGPRPIESLQVGDRVLGQDVATGMLEYRSVLATHRNTPAPTMRIAVGGEVLVATELQPFWEAGKGWTMARDLKAGDRLRIIGGVARIGSVEKSRTEPVHNIDVAGPGDLFVGKGRFLAHDFGFIPAIPEPFDRSAEPNPTARPARP